MNKHLSVSVGRNLLTVLITASFLISTLLIPHKATADDTETITFEPVFEVTIDQRGNPDDQSFMVAGTLTLNIHTTDGSFTGRITPGAGIKGDDNSVFPLTSVLFLGDERIPQEGVTEIAVNGQIQGRAVNMIIESFPGSPLHIFVNGTTDRDPGLQFENYRDGIRMAGPAVGPKPGDRGDWVVDPMCIVLGLDAVCVVHQPAQP